MAVNVIALGLTAGISIVIPLIILGIVIRKNPMERIGILISFLIGAGIYILMEWGVKEQGLKYLFNHTALSDFMNRHYIPYLLFIAAAGALLALLPELLVIRFFFHRQVSFAKAAMLGMGYAMAEAVILVGYRSIYTIIELLQKKEMNLNTETAELFLSGYERMLMMVIHVAVLVSFVYFIEQKMALRGSIITMICLTMAAFLPGFLIAFSLKNYYEVYDRTVGLVLVYILLTAGAICGGVVLNSLKYSLKDERIDSKQAILAYRKKWKKKIEKSKKINSKDFKKG